MKFQSTRGDIAETFLEAFNKGLAGDGGLYIPTELPNLTDRFDSLAKLSYPELVAEFMSYFDNEISKEDWKKLAAKSYEAFASKDVVSLVELTTDLHVLELFHGPTLAFKDFALQIVGNLYEYEVRVHGKRYTIVGATSGDTGSAAIHSVLNKENIDIFIMYPKGKIAPLQELQITTTVAHNVFPISIEGTFDDAQAIVKKLFADTEFSQRINLAAVNSINIARILAQSAYYLYAFLKLRSTTKLPIKFVVPTGNFGNILSGWLLTKMGMDASFVAATNENDVLHKLFTTGMYQKQSAQSTHAPSMDIQQASNFERLIYYMFEGDTERVVRTMKEFNEKGNVAFDTNLFPKNITTATTSNENIIEVIKSFFTQYNYILDPHTACAAPHVTPGYCNVILATASPAKFPDTIENAIKVHPTDPRLESVKDLPQQKVELPADIEKVKKYILETI